MELHQTSQVKDTFLQKIALTSGQQLQAWGFLGTHTSNQLVKNLRVPVTTSGSVIH